MSYHVKFNDITSMHGQTNQTIQQWGDALKELQKSIASLANNSELQGKAMTSAKRYMTEVHGTFIQTLMQLMNEYTASFLLYKDGYYQIDTHNHAELPEDVYKGLHSDLGKSKQRFEQQLEQLTTAKLRVEGLVNYQGTSHTKTKFTYEKLMKDIKHLDESITQYEEMHARQDLQAFKELLDATKSLLAEHSSRDRSMGSYQVGDFLQLSSINRFMLAAQQSAVYLNDHMTQIQAAQEREQLRVESIYAEERSKQGAMNLVFGVLTLIAGVSALVMSGGTMLPIVAAAFKVGALATFMYGASNSIEAGQNIYYGLSGDGKSFAMNPIRDTIFLGNGELYHGVGQVFTLTTGVFIPIAQTQSIAQGISQFFWGTVGGLATGQAAYHGTKLLGGNEDTAQLMNLLGNFVGGYAVSKAAKKFSLNQPVFSNRYSKIDFTQTDFDVELIRGRLKTNPDTAFFWSGRTDGIGGMDVAKKIAKNKGGVTLESTIDDTNIVMPEWDFNTPSSVTAWEEASNVYAEQVSGEIRAVVGSELRPGNIWENIELPRLKVNPNVTKVTTIDPKTGVEKIIFER